jgi:hypothetical protein
MKRLFWAIVFASVFATQTQAELQDVVEGSVTHHAVYYTTNETSTEDLQRLMELNVWNFKVHRSSPTNGLSVNVETRIASQTTKTVANLDLDRGTLENMLGEHVGEDIQVLVAMNPVGGLDGETILSARKLHFVIRMAGVQTACVAENPFSKCKDGPTYWKYAAKESPTVFKLMDCNTGTHSSGPKTELTARFHEF